MKTCKVDDCNQKIVCNGYCNRHRLQIAKHGKILQWTRLDKNRIINYNDYCEICLYDVKGKEINRTKIDKDDLEKIKGYKWCLRKDNGCVITKINNRKISLHQLILSKKDKYVIVHKDKNSLNNKKENLEYMKGSGECPWKSKIRVDFLGEKHPMYGKHHSKESKIKMSETRQYTSDKTRKKMSDSKKGNINSLGHKLSDEAKKIISMKNNGRKLSRETLINRRIISGGEKHWAWKGGISKLTEIIRKCFVYKEWRSLIYKRDKFTCQSCGLRNGLGKKIYLHSHHIKMFSKIIEENHIKTMEDAIACVELWDINNGITLCKKCHNLFHKIYGKKNNNKEQLNEFLQKQNLLINIENLLPVEPIRLSLLK